MWDEKRLKIAARNLADYEMDKAGMGYPDRGIERLANALTGFWTEAMRRANEFKKEVSA